MASEENYDRSNRNQEEDEDSGEHDSTASEDESNEDSEDHGGETPTRINQTAYESNKARRELKYCDPKQQVTPSREPPATTDQETAVIPTENNLKEFQSFEVDVKLDPTTVQQSLVLSTDGKTLRYGGLNAEVPNTEGPNTAERLPFRRS
ncbi:unnamed protein product [Ophioblennius macclurei]